MLESVIIKDCNIKSDINMLSEQFIRGDHFTLELSDYVFKNIARLSEKKYIEHIKEIKELLCFANITFFSDLLIIKSNKQISEEQKTVLVRYINLCHGHKQLIILYNKDVIYIPMEFISLYGKEAVYMHINSVYRNFNNRRKMNFINRKFKVKNLIPFLH